MGGSSSKPVASDGQGASELMAELRDVRVLPTKVLWQATSRSATFRAVFADRHKALEVIIVTGMVGVERAYVNSQPNPTPISNTEAALGLAFWAGRLPFLPDQASGDDQHADQQTADRAVSLFVVQQLEELCDFSRGSSLEVGAAVAAELTRRLLAKGGFHALDHMANAAESVQDLGIRRGALPVLVGALALGQRQKPIKMGPSGCDALRLWLLIPAEHCQCLETLEGALPRLVSQAAADALLAGDVGHAAALHEMTPKLVAHAPIILARSGGEAGRGALVEMYWVMPSMLVPRALTDVIFDEYEIHVETCETLNRKRLGLEAMYWNQERMLKSLRQTQAATADEMTKLQRKQAEVNKLLRRNPTDAEKERLRRELEKIKVAYDKALERHIDRDRRINDLAAEHRATSTAWQQVVTKMKSMRCQMLVLSTDDIDKENEGEEQEAMGDLEGGDRGGAAMPLPPATSAELSGGKQSSAASATFAAPSMILQPTSEMLRRTATVSEPEFLWMAEPLHIIGGSNTRNSFIWEPGSVVSKIEGWGLENEIRGLRFHFKNGAVSDILGHMEGAHYSIDLDETVVKEASLYGNGIGTRLGEIWIKTEKNPNWQYIKRHGSGAQEYSIVVGSGFLAGAYVEHGDAIDCMGLVFVDAITEVQGQQIWAAPAPVTTERKPLLSIRLHNTRQEGEMFTPERKAKSKTVRRVEYQEHWTVKAKISYEFTAMWSAGVPEASKTEVSLKLGGLELEADRGGQTIKSEEVEKEEELFFPSVSVRPGELFDYMIHQDRSSVSVPYQTNIVMHTRRRGAYQLTGKGRVKLEDTTKLVIEPSAEHHCEAKFDQVHRNVLKETRKPLSGRGEQVN